MAVLLAEAGLGCPLSDPLYLLGLGSGPDPVSEPAAATLHSFSFSPSSFHVSVAWEWPRSSETPSEREEFKKSRKAVEMMTRCSVCCFLLFLFLKQTKKIFLLESERHLIKFILFFC